MPFSNYIYEYYDGISSGNITVGKWVRLLYEYIVKGLQEGLFTFNAKKANKAIRFIENFCHHCEGRTDLLKLELWQKAAVSVMGVIYPIFVAAFSAPHIWHVNIYLPIVLSVVCLIMTIVTPFRYDDERATKTDGNNGIDEAQAEIQAAKDAMLKKPGVLVQVFTLVMAFICMFIMYGAQQYTKAFGMANLGLDEMGGAALASIYTVGSITAVFFWAVVMGKLRWNPLKVLLIDFAFSALALALVLVVPNVAIVYVAIALLGFFAAGGALQTGLVVRQNYCPGPKGRNTGMYMTFMGVGATFLPFIVGAMTTAMGETGALYTMMGLLLAAAIVGLLFCIYLAIQSKPLFGYGINRKMD